MALPVGISTNRRSPVGKKHDKQTRFKKMARPEVSKSDQISTVEDSMTTDDDSSTTGNGVTQAEVYDNLKRIGELEDEKKRIQEEIWDRTEQLRGVIKHIDQTSILYKILESALANSAPRGGISSGRKTASAKGAPKTSTKALKKKTRRK